MLPPRRFRPVSLLAWRQGPGTAHLAACVAMTGQTHPSLAASRGLGSAVPFSALRSQIRLRARGEGTVNMRGLMLGIKMSS